MAQYKFVIIIIWYLFLSWASDMFMKSSYAAELKELCLEIQPNYVITKFPFKLRET